MMKNTNVKSINVHENIYLDIAAAFSSSGNEMIQFSAILQALALL